ncbi:hypothetical protein YC2023_071056 [Brassica napus]
MVPIIVYENCYRKTLLKQLSQVIHAPSVQFQDTPPISQVTEEAEEDMETR